MKKRNKILVFDTETTGLIKPESNKIGEQPYIIEIACYKFDADFTNAEKFETYIKPPVPIPDFITKITGVSDEDVKDAPTFAEAFNDIANFHVGVDTWVAHNINFDRNMLANELMRIDNILRFPYPPNHICTVRASMPIQQRRMNLQALHNHFFGKDFVGAHRAMTDVKATAKCFKKLCEQGFIE